MWPMQILEWDLKVKIKQKIFWAQIYKKIGPKLIYPYL